MKKLWAVIIGLAFWTSLLFLGCKATLEPGGAYAPTITNATTGAVSATQAPDIGLFQADFAFDTAHSAASLVFNAERANRALLWKISPTIKHTLDKIRPDFAEAEKDYALARQTYLQNPIQANMDSLNTTLAQMKAITAAAQSVMAQYMPQPK